MDTVDLIIKSATTQMKLLDMGFWQIGFDKDENKGLQVAH